MKEYTYFLESESNAFAITDKIVIAKILILAS